MELVELKESVRKIMLKNNLEVLNMLANGHNLIGCIENKQWERLPKLIACFIDSYNSVIEELNKHENKTNFDITVEDVKSWVKDKHGRKSFDEELQVPIDKCYDMMLWFARDINS